MAQFDVVPHPIASLRQAFPLAVILRSDLIAPGEETVIAPLVPRRHFPSATGRLSPIVRIDEEDYVVLVDRLVTLQVRSLPRRIANISAHREAIQGAIDLLFFGV